MEMIERYLEAVRFWLPKGQKDDIIQELSADIDAQIEEREAVLGHALAEPEIESILKQRGRPVVVANRFLPQEQLIGPLLFPVYRFVVKIICLCYLLPWALVWVGITIYDHVYRAQQTHASWFGEIVSRWSSLMTVAFITIGSATVVFAVLERVQAKSNFLNNWSPRKLPPVRNPNKIPRATSIFELAFTLLFFVWWAASAFAGTINLANEVRIELSQQWVWFCSAYLVLTAANAYLSGVNLLRPYWTVSRAALRLLCDSIGAALFCLLLRAHIVTSFSAASLTAEQSLQVTHAIDQWMGIAFPWSIVVSLVIVAAGVYRVVRTGRADSLTP